MKTHASKPLFFLLSLVVSLLLFSSGSHAEGFSSTPVLTATPNELYNYTVTMDTNWSNLSMTSTADWLVVSNGTNITGIPTVDDVGVYLVNLTLTNDTATVYQNYTLVVSPLPASNLPSNQYLVLTLVVGFALVFVGFIDKRWMFFAGIVWIYLALAVFSYFGIPWMLIGLGFGLVLFLTGAMELSEKGG